MRQDPLPFEVDMSRGNSNTQSELAHSKVIPQKANLRSKVYQLIAWSPMGMTLYEIADALNKPVNSLSGRLSELRFDNHIKPEGSRPNKYGNECAVYVVKNG